MKFLKKIQENSAFFKEKLMLRHGNKQSHYLWTGFGKHSKNDAIFDAQSK
jgi:hypothetical protein